MYLGVINTDYNTIIMKGNKAKQTRKQRRNMSVLSFDIGIKNLSYCYLEGDTPDNHAIRDWGIWDLRLEREEGADVANENINDNIHNNQGKTLTTETIQNNKIKCGCKGKNGKNCRSKPLFYEKVNVTGGISGMLKSGGNSAGGATKPEVENRYYCRVHMSQCRSLFTEADTKKIHKMKKAECLQLIQDKHIPIIQDDYSSVHELKKLIKEHIQNNCLMKIKKPKKCKTFPLDKLHKNLYQYITNFLRNKHITKVQIENQPVKINATMKTIQIMLYSIIQSFYYLNPELPKPDVTFLNAKHKGTIYDGPPVECKTKDPYRRRKMLSIAHSKYFLELTDQDKWLEYFVGNSKKDDLADAYLMCLYFLKDY
jgi:hypothetical protein